MFASCERVGLRSQKSLPGLLALISVFEGHVWARHAISDNRYSMMQFLPQSIRLAHSALTRSSQLCLNAARRVPTCSSLDSVF